MSVTRDSQWEEEGPRPLARGIPSPQDEGSRRGAQRWEGDRRSLLGAAAGGLALAARGLFLPEWLVEEAAADNHPVRRVQKRKDRQRQKRRNHREHNRRIKRRRQDANEGGGSGLGNNFRGGIVFRLSNDGSSPSVVQSYAYYADGGFFSAETWHKARSETIQSGGTLRDRTSRQESAILIDDRFWIMANNPLVGWPEIYFRYDGSVKPESFVGYVGKTAISQMGFAVGIGPVIRTIDGRRFSFMRTETEFEDGQGHVVFTIHYT